ncbi:MAG: hypothetical protein IKV47_06690 [Oscillospiraceae bacterium]|nr:hypothetical protein [Oscillospiraceae bacterium]
METNYRFEEICKAAHSAEDITGSLADLWCYEAMFSLYYSYHFGAVDIEAAKNRTNKLKREYINAKEREALNLEGYQSKQRIYREAGELIRAYRSGECAADVFAEKIIAVINGK